MAAPAAAAAQSAPGNAAKPNTTIPEKQAPPATSLSHKTLPHRSVIKPKHNVDPGMVKRPPKDGSGTMRVIRPKGTTGESPGATPK